jgi:hypothetical protein
MKGFIFCNLFPYQEENWDTLTKWIVDEHVYHNMDRCMEMDIKELGEIHMSLNKDKTMRNRAICLGKLLVRRLHKYEKDAFFSKLIPAEMFVKAKKMYDEHEERSMRSKDLSPMSIYGFDHYSEKDNSGVSKSKKKRKK